MKIIYETPEGRILPAIAPCPLCTSGSDSTTPQLSDEDYDFGWEY